MDGLLDPERGETLLTALRAATPPRRPDDTHPAANRRAQALDEICRCRPHHVDIHAGRIQLE